MGRPERIETGSKWLETPFIKDQTSARWPGGQGGLEMKPRSEMKGDGAGVACWLAGLRDVQVADGMWGAGRRR